MMEALHAKFTQHDELKDRWGNECSGLFCPVIEAKCEHNPDRRSGQMCDIVYTQLSQLLGYVPFGLRIRN